MKFSKKSGKSLMNSCQKTEENVVIIRDSMDRWEHNFASFQQVVGRCNNILSKFASTQGESFLTSDFEWPLLIYIDNR